jgi:hypothetical protein
MIDVVNRALPSNERIAMSDTAPSGPAAKHVTAKGWRFERNITINASPDSISLDPHRLIEYETALFGGMLRAIHYIEIHPEGPSTSRVVNGEILGGPLPRKWESACSRRWRA